MQEKRLERVAGYLAIIQFLLATTWVIYIVYLGDLLDKIGIGRDKLLWFILLDMFLFALMDILMGIGADRAGHLMKRLGPFILVGNTLSCLAFAALPWIAGGDNASPLEQGFWVAALVLWIATSSVLKAPAFVLLTKHAAKPQIPWLVALSLTGLALGGAIGPYLGLVLKTVDPLLPFWVAAAVLWVATIGLIYMERYAEDQPSAKATQPAATPVNVANKKHLLLLSLLGGALFLALGFQLHSFVNSKAHYLKFAQPEQLVWLMPVFWIGFQCLAMPGAKLAKKYDPLLIMLLAVPLGAGALWLAVYSTNLNTLIGAQLLAGGTWGVLLMGGIAAAVSIGGKTKSGLLLGSWFSMLALGALIRVLMVMNELPKQTAFATWLEILPALCWILAGLCFYMTRKIYRS